MFAFIDTERRRPPSGTYEPMDTSMLASGDSQEYFAEYKRRLLARMLGSGFAEPVLDFGCGVGILTARLVQAFPMVDGYDPSPERLKRAAERSPGARFFDDPEALPIEHYGAVVLANALHHVPRPNRPGLMQIIAATLVRGGRLVIFEQNPLNLLVQRAAHSEGVDLPSPRETRRLLRGAGLRKVRLEYVAFLPPALGFAQQLERSLTWLPLGTQVCAWGVKR